MDVIKTEKKPQSGPFLDQMSQRDLEVKTKPDDRILDALMHCVRYGNSNYSEESQEKSPEFQIKNFLGVLRRDEYYFKPPKEIQHPEKSNKPLDVYWKEIASLILFQAQIGVNSQGSINKLNSEISGLKQVSNIHKATSTRQDVNTWFNINTEGAEAKKVREEVKATVDLIKNRYRAEAATVLADGETMNAIITAAEVKKEVARAIVIQQNAEYVDHVRAQVESAEEKELFLDLLQQMIGIVHNDPKIGWKNHPTYKLEAELLDSGDAVGLGCEGLFVAERRKNWADNSFDLKEKLAKICIPMSHYGTTQLLEWDEILQVVAHEIGHFLKYIMDTSSDYKKEVQKSFEEENEHGVFHTILTGQVLQLLRAADVKMDYETRKITLRAERKRKQEQIKKQKEIAERNAEQKEVSPKEPQKKNKPKEEANILNWLQKREWKKIFDWFNEKKREKINWIKEQW